MSENIQNILSDILERIRKSDNVVLASSLMLMAISVILIYSTTKNPFYETTRQVVFFMMAYGAMFFMLYVHYNHIRKIAKHSWLFIFILLLALTIFGSEINGAKRWIKMPFIGSLQPSELVRMLYVFFVAYVLAKYQTKKGCDDLAFKIIAPFTLIVCGWVGITDMSTAFLIGLSGFIMMVVGRVHRKFILPIFLTATITIVLLFIIAVKTDFRPDVGRISTGFNRIERFWNPEKAEQRELAHYEQLKTKSAREAAKRRIDRHHEQRVHKEAAKAAVATSAFIGSGPGNSNGRYVVPLPYSDYAFAIIVEQLGLIAVLVILISYISLIYRAGSTAKRCTRTFPALLVLGLAMMIVLQGVVNMSVSLDLLPVTGQPLPFVTKGGSSILVTGATFGIIMSVTYWLKKEEEAEAEKIAKKEAKTN